jgi:hypothetical protein
LGTHTALKFFSFLFGGAVAKEMAKREVVVCAMDPSPKNYCYWIGRLKRPEELLGLPGECLIKDLAEEKFPCPDDGRSNALVEHLIDKQPLFPAVTHFDAEAQNPLTRIPGHDRTYSGNCVSYGIAQSTEATIMTTRRERKLPAAEFRFSSPRTKFFTLGMPCPKEKYRRKRKIVIFQRECFAAHQDDPTYRYWEQRTLHHFTDHTKGTPKYDDVSDVRAQGIARLIRIRAGMDKPKKGKR